MLETGFSAATGGVSLIVRRVAGHLTNRARIAPKRTAAVFTTTTALGLNVVAIAKITTGAARGDNRKDGNGNVNDRIDGVQGHDNGRVVFLFKSSFLLFLRQLIWFVGTDDEGKNVRHDNISRRDNEHDFKGGHGRSTARERRTKDIQLHSSLNLTQSTQSAPEAQAAHGVAAPKSTAIA